MLWSPMFSASWTGIFLMLSAEWKYLKVLNPDKKQLAKLNKLRVLAEMPELVF